MRYYVHSIFHTNSSQHWSHPGLVRPKASASLSLQWSLGLPVLGDQGVRELGIVPLESMAIESIAS